MNKVYQIITDKFIKALEEGVIPWEKPWNSVGLMPKNAVTNKTYSGVNIMLLAMCMYKSPFWVTYKQAQELGGSVKEGEKSQPVTYWNMTYIDTKTDEKLKPAVARKWLKDKAKRSRVKCIPFLRYYNVWNIEQTEDIPEEALPEIPESPSANHEPDELAEGFIKSYIDREHIGTKQSSIAAYSPQADEILMPPMEDFPELAKYYSTYFHEMIHSTGHATRLARELVGNMESKSYSKEELTAEIGASFMNHHCGFLDNTIENSKGYIQHWLKRLKEDDGVTYIVHASSRAQKATEFILGNSEKAKPTKKVAKAELV